MYSFIQVAHNHVKVIFQTAYETMFSCRPSNAKLHMSLLMFNNDQIYGV